MVVGAFVGVVVVVARHRVALNVCHEGLRTDSFKKQPGGLEGEPVLPDAGMTGHRTVRGGAGWRELADVRKSTGDSRAHLFREREVPRVHDEPERVRDMGEGLLIDSDPILKLTKTTERRRGRIGYWSAWLANRNGHRRRPRERRDRRGT